MQRQKIIRALLFVVFFGIGASAVSISILCDDLLGYYRNRQLLRKAQESLNQLESLNADYDALLQQLDKDPNLIRRIAPVTLGAEPEEEEAVYPKAAERELAAARKALMEDSGRENTEPAAPDWVVRCCEPSRRIILFLAGAFLILISFIWFGSKEDTSGEG
jgi:hypothetical protein